ncbi:hypothetical protein HEAFMP_HEAFMP_04605, partial [Dysosmobacter welbionis]
ALRVLLKGHQAVVLQLALLDGLIHGLADDAGNGVGHPGGGHALQQRPHLGGGDEEHRQRQSHQQKRQGPQHPPAVHPPAVEVKSAPDHGHHAPFPPLYAGAAWPYFRAFTRSLKTRPRSMK